MELPFVSKSTCICPSAPASSVYLVLFGNFVNNVKEWSTYLDYLVDFVPIDCSLHALWLYSFPLSPLFNRVLFRYFRRIVLIAFAITALYWRCFVSLCSRIFSVELLVSPLDGGDISIYLIRRTNTLMFLCLVFFWS